MIKCLALIAATSCLRAASHAAEVKVLSAGATEQGVE